jgi:hypothetical protein
MFMKRIVASVGLVALGAASIESLYAQAFTAAKPFTAAVALRGFYDDNVNTAKDGEIDTFGFEISPSIAAGIETDQTSAWLRYEYSYKYYDKRPDPTQDHNDQTHTISANLLHNFTERTSVSVSDSFVIGQEPDFLRSPNGGIDSPQRISGNNIRNFGRVGFNHQFTPLLGIGVGYQNSFFDYEADFGNSGLFPSASGLLDRIEHRGNLDARWTLSEPTVVLVGYAFGATCYNGDELIGFSLGDPVFSDMRNSYSHYAYAGVEHKFLPNLFGKLKGGVQFYDPYDAEHDDASVTPFLEGTLSYTYAEGSDVSVGVSHQRTASDAFSVDVGTGSYTVDRQTTLAYGSVTHRILPNLFGSLSATFQNTIEEGGEFDGDSEQYYLLGASLAYQFNRHVAATLSYNYDLIESDIVDRGYDRNRVFLGATFTY